MKKLILLAITVLMLVGVIFVGRSVLNASNIEKVEIEGNIQTLYLLNEAAPGKPDFQDAKLKVVYKNGKFKYVSMKDAEITVDNFDTSLTRSLEMLLTYKTHVLKVNYSVINGGMYYLSGKKTESYVNNKPVTVSNPTYSMSTTKAYFHLEDQATKADADKGTGYIKYYNYSDADSKWLLYDGKYLANYRYEVVDDALKIYLGSKTPAYEIKALRDANGNLATYSSITNKDSSTGLDLGRVTHSFANCNKYVATNVKANSLEVISNNFTTDSQYPGFKFLNFRVSSNPDVIKSPYAHSSNRILLKVKNSKYIIDSTSVQLFKEVYVVFGDEMIKDGSLNVSEPTGYAFFEFAYEGLGTNPEDRVFYKVAY